jgi:hypothetical protein
MTERLPQPGHDLPLTIRHRMDAERTARVGRARTVGTSKSHRPSLQSKAAPAWLSAIAFSLTRQASCRARHARQPRAPLGP